MFVYQSGTDPSAGRLLWRRNSMTGSLILWLSNRPSVRNRPRLLHRHASPTKSWSPARQHKNQRPLGEQRNGAAPAISAKAAQKLREEGCDVRTWATFTDISLNGCYVEAQATYPAGTLLHMKMEVNGIRFEAKGKVRVSYPYLGMGIAFEEISD